MQALFNIINKPLGWFLESIAGILGGNFAAAVFVFTLIINIAMIPLSIKSQKSSVQQMRIKPKLDELKKRYGDDKQKYSMAMQKLYQEENVSMAGGCLPMILRLVLMLSIYYLIMSPLTYLLHIDADVINQAAKAIGKSVQRTPELNIIEAIKAGTINFPVISEKLSGIDFNLFGIDLTQKPKFSFDIFHDVQLIWIMPIIAFAAQLLSSLISVKIQKKVNPEAPSMAGMLYTMPLLSLFIGFTLPGGVTFYWACSSLIGGLIQAGVQIFYSPHKMLANERAKELTKQCLFEEGQIKKITASDNE
ncbi:MAG: YidC/Oxa1 family membrane protein insertase [Acutalibacteraceae bacterium]|jgi:YidC/Oxa1 family membrane protein insertase